MLIIEIAAFLSTLGLGALLVIVGIRETGTDITKYSSRSMQVLAANFACAVVISYFLKYIFI